MDINLTMPSSGEEIEKLRAGDRVLITGEIYTARDAAHKKMIELLDRGEQLPIEIKNAAIYYVGPTPARPGMVMGAAGPTTSGRMDAYAPRLLDLGLKVMIGKGVRNKNVVEAMIRNKAVYLAAIGGAGALIGKCIKKAEVVAYEELGAEAIMKLWVEDFPAIVAIDSNGNSLYQR